MAKPELTILTACYVPGKVVTTVRESSVSSLDLLCRMKSEGVLGDFVHVGDDGTVLIRARTSSEGYNNGLRFHRLVREYARTNRITTARQPR